MSSSTKTGDKMPLLDKTKEGASAGANSKEGKRNDSAREMTTKEAYFASLGVWVKNANIAQNAMALFPWYLISSYPQMFQNAGVTPPTATQQPTAGAGVVGGNAGTVMPPPPPRADLRDGFRAPLRMLMDPTQSDIIARNGGFEYNIAPFWKRVFAEIIDVILLLLLKVIITFTIINLFDVEVGFELNGDVLRKAIDDDDISTFLSLSMDFLAFSSDLLILEVVTKVLVCINEALWTTMYNGATPGKAVMNLRIVHVEALHPLPPLQEAVMPFEAARMQMRALLFPAQTPAFKRAFLRAVAKNLIITLLFPMCFLMIFFKNNRTIYDIITKTIVVEHNPNPVYRRP